MKLCLSELPLWSLMVSSSYSQIAVTIERYIGIVHPMFHHTSFSKKNVIFLAIASWWPGPMLKLCFTVPTSNVINGSCAIIVISNQPLRRASGVTFFRNAISTPNYCDYYMLQQDIYTSTYSCTSGNTKSLPRGNG